jgi:hypothetical protein
LPRGERQIQIIGIFEKWPTTFYGKVPFSLTHPLNKIDPIYNKRLVGTNKLSLLLKNYFQEFTIVIYKRLYHHAKQSLYKQKIIKSTKENEMLKGCLGLDEDGVNEIKLLNYNKIVKRYF